MHLPATDFDAQHTPSLGLAEAHVTSCLSICHLLLVNLAETAVVGEEFLHEGERDVLPNPFQSFKNLLMWKNRVKINISHRVFFKCFRTCLEASAPSVVGHPVNI